MPKDTEFESILCLARNAHERKTNGKELEHHGPLSYETFSNKAGWSAG